jgi:hypothetical protein
MEKGPKGSPKPAATGVQQKALSNAGACSPATHLEATKNWGLEVARLRNMQPQYEYASGKNRSVQCEYTTVHHLMTRYSYLYCDYHKITELCWCCSHAGLVKVGGQSSLIRSFRIIEMSTHTRLATSGLSCQRAVSVPRTRRSSSQITRSNNGSASSSVSLLSLGLGNGRVLDTGGDNPPSDTVLIPPSFESQYPVLYSYVYSYSLQRIRSVFDGAHASQKPAMRVKTVVTDPFNLPDANSVGVTSLYPVSCLAYDGSKCTCNYLQVFRGRFAMITCVVSQPQALPLPLSHPLESSRGCAAPSGSRLAGVSRNFCWARRRGTNPKEMRRFVLGPREDPCLSLLAT